MARWAVVNQVSGAVENVVEWDGDEPWTPGDGRVAVEDTDSTAQIGGTWTGSGFEPAPPPEA